MDGIVFTPARFPPGSDIEENGYRLHSTASEAIIVDVYAYTGDQGTPMGTLLISNSAGITFTLSIDYTNRNDNGEVDFERMQGLRGTLLVNVVTNPEEVLSGGIKSLASKISFNDGGRWLPIKAPTYTVNGQPYVCAVLGSCSLHLHSVTERSQAGLVFSSSTAVGMMMGVGNVGNSLTAYDQGNTYLTRDGGVTWQEVRLGAHMYEFADRGALLVIVNDEDPTDHIRYSWNEGLTWTSYVFSLGTKIRARWLTTDPDSTSQKFLLFGDFKDINNVTHNRMVQLDFTGLHETKCQTTDFEVWTPVGAGDPCLLGSQVTYRRRKQNVTCYIDDDSLNTVVSTTSCQCVADDFEW